MIMTQPTIFNSTNRVIVVNDYVKCPRCSHEFEIEIPKEKYWKSLDGRLIKLLWDCAVDALKSESGRVFNPRWVWQGLEPIKATRTILDFQKLHYWDLVKRVENKSGWWRITDRGMDFLKGRIQVEKRVKIDKNVVVETDGPMVHIGNADPRWQQSRGDYVLDFSL